MNLIKRYAPFGLGLTPLLPGWAVALAGMPGVPAARVHVTGTLAASSALVLGVPIWVALSRERARFVGSRRSIALHIAAAILFASAWVWAQYALNPYRMLSVLDAMQASRSISWQFVNGVWIYAAYVAIAWRLHDRSVTREQPTHAPVLEEHGRSPLNHFVATVGRRTIVIPVERVERISGCDDYAAVHGDGQRLLVSHRLGELEGRLDRSWFVRIHRSHIVNLDFVVSVEGAESGRLVAIMKDGERLRSSRAGAAALRAGLVRHRGDGSSR